MPVILMVQEDQHKSEIGNKAFLRLKIITFSQIPNMYSLKSIPSTTSVLSTYTTFTATAMLVRGVISEVQAITSQLIPERLRIILLSKLGGLFSNPSSQMTLLIEEYNGFSVNVLYEASEIYLQNKITSSMQRLIVSKGSRDEKIEVTITKGEKVIDIFEGIQLKWEMTCVETKENHQGKSEKAVMELCFHNTYMETVINSYLPYVMERAKAIKEANKVVKLYSRGNPCGGEMDGEWGYTKLDHPATFDTLAMDPSLKKELIDDLDRFVRRRDFYRRVGKAWKRGYLLYGPPGTGKSSLIAAMANYLKFHVYDLELTSLYNNSELQRLLVSTRNRSILVIEDIDCSIKFQDRVAGEYDQFDHGHNQITLSGLLNFIDGLWSSCGDERIIVFTTNHKDKLDTALLRPGRMDVHIHMSYCTPSGFRILASNYLDITCHNLFSLIDELMNEVEITPAEVAEELMKSEDADIALEGLITFMQNKKLGSGKLDSNGGEAYSEEDNESNESGTEVENKRKAKGGRKQKMLRLKRSRNERKITSTIVQVWPQ